MGVIDYVDRWLKHWAQEMAAMNAEDDLGLRSPNWVAGANAVGSETGRASLRAQGKASRSGPKVCRLGSAAERIDQELQKLSDREKQIIDAYYLSHPHLTVTEKALEVGCSLKTLYKHIHNAHEKLSAALPDSYALRGPSYPQCG